MLKRLLLVCTLYYVAVPLHAAPRWLTAVPRQIGRTYGNMFTFKHPVLALGQWAGFAAVAFDEKTTVDLFSRCRGCVETGFFNHGQRYGFGTAALNTVLAGTWYASWEQFSDEGLRDDPNKYWRNAGKTLFVAPVVFHTYFGVSNMGVK